MKHLKQGLVLLSLGCVIVLALVLIGGPAVAVAPHKHCLLTPQGWVEVGPRVFVRPHLHDNTAFHNFHSNVHVGGLPLTIGAVTTATAPCSSLPIP